MKRLRHTMRLLPAVAAAAASGCMAGCASKDCYDNQNSLPLAGIYTSTEFPQPTVLGRVTVYGLGVPSDSLLLHEAVSVESLYLPFRIDADETTYVFEFLDPLRNGARDEVTFRYSRQPWFVSEACGVIYKYHVLDITTTGHVIDSVVCADGVITNKPQENLRIYIKPLPREGGEE